MSSERKPEDLRDLVRARDLRAMGLTRTDAERVMRGSGSMIRFGRSVYAKREAVEKYLREHESSWPTRG